MYAGRAVHVHVCKIDTLPVTLLLWLQNEIKLSVWPEAVEKQVLYMLIIHSLVNFLVYAISFCTHTHKHYPSFGANPRDDFVFTSSVALVYSVRVLSDLISN